MAARQETTSVASAEDHQEVDQLTHGGERAGHIGHGGGRERLAYTRRLGVAGDEPELQLDGGAPARR